MSHIKCFYININGVPLERCEDKSEGSGPRAVYVCVLRPPRRVPAGLWGCLWTQWVCRITRGGAIIKTRKRSGQRHRHPFESGSARREADRMQIMRVARQLPLTGPCEDF